MQEIHKFRQVGREHISAGVRGLPVVLALHISLGGQGVVVVLRMHISAGVRGVLVVFVMYMDCSSYWECTGREVK